MKGCLILGPKSVTWYKDGYPLLKSKELFIGHHGRLEDEGIWLEDKDGVPAKVLCLWYTTLTVKDYDKPFVLTKNCESQEYSYDNYDAINVNRVQDIPYDYEGVMGVPITIFDHNLDYVYDGCLYGDHTIIDGKYIKGHRPILNGKQMYSRALIKKLQI